MLRRSCVCGDIHLRGKPCPKAVARAKARSNSRPANPAYRDPEYRKNRVLLIARAMRNGEPCIRCGRQFASGRDITADHILPISRGGTNELWNLGPACSRCNSSHGGSLNKRGNA